MTAETAVRIRPGLESDLDQVLAVRDDAIRSSTALWTSVPATRDETAAYLDGHLARGSILVAEVDGAFAGYAVYGPFRPHDGYRHTVENSVYVVAAAQGRGIGATLLAALMTRAREAGMHAMVAGIEATNVTSIRLHERLGFSMSGTLPQVGTKFGRWLDLTFMVAVLA